MDEHLISAIACTDSEELLLFGTLSLSTEQSKKNTQNELKLQLKIIQIAMNFKVADELEIK